MAAMCPLCLEIDGPDTPLADCEDEGAGAMHVNCPRCGTFRMEGVKEFEADEETRLRLSGLARITTDEGQEPLTISNESCHELAARAPAPATMGGYYDLLLRLIAQRCKRPGGETQQFPLAPLAARAFLPKKSCTWILTHSTDLLTPRFSTFDELRLKYQLPPEGWRRVDELTRQSPQGDRAFVAMWFSPKLSAAYTNGFHAALTACGYEPPFRVDAPEHQNRANEPDFKSKIDDRILAEIRRARFVVTDATGARPSVYYEAGFADGLGTPVIWTCRARNEKDTAFDTRQNEHILWRDPANLLELLTAKIERRGWKRAVEQCVPPCCDSRASGVWPRSSKWAMLAAVADQSVA